MMVDETDMAAALKALAESRAANGDAEARIAELEAVIELVRGYADDRAWYGRTNRTVGSSRIASDLFAIIDASPSVVLADRDREVAARAIEDAIESLQVWAGSQENSKHIEHLRERAAAIRSVV